MICSSIRSINNLSQLLYGSTQLLVVATGVTYVIITGALDLSVGSGVMASAIVLNYFSKNGVPVLPAVLLAVMTGAVAGLVNGLVVTKLKCNAYLATYGMQLILKGIGLTISNGSQINTANAVKQIFRYKVFGIVPLYFIVAIIVIFAAQYVLKYTPFGRKGSAVGCNAKGARCMGINTDWIRCSAFIITGALAGVAGVLMAVNTGAATVNTGSGYEFNAVIS